MISSIAVGVVGANRRARALTQHFAPFRGIRLSRWAASPGAQDESHACALARDARVQFTPNWEAIAQDPALTAVLILSDVPEKTAAVTACLSAGKVVFCPPPVAVKSADLDLISTAQQRGGGLFLSSGEISHTPAGGRALQLITNGELGTLHSIYAAIRLPRGNTSIAQGVIFELGWEVLDFLLASLSAPVRQVYAVGGHLFESGPEEDTAITILRFEDNVIATVELSRCLPLAIPSAGLGEVEIEAIGSRQVVRIEPYNTSVRVYGDHYASIRPWIDNPMISMMDELVAAVDGKLPRVDSLAKQRRASALMDAIRASLASERAIEMR